MTLPILNVPKYTTTLPFSKREINYRPFLVKEEKILMMMTQSKTTKDISSAIREIIINCVDELEEADVKKLATVDAEWLFIQLRIASVGQSADLQIKDKDDGKFYLTEIDLNDIKYTVDETHSDIIMINDTIGLKMKPISYELSEELTDVDDEDITSLLKLTVASIFDSDDNHQLSDSSIEEQDVFFSQLNINNIEAVQKYFETMPTLELRVEYFNSDEKKAKSQTIRNINDFF